MPEAGQEKLGLAQQIDTASSPTEIRHAEPEPAAEETPIQDNEPVRASLPVYVKIVLIAFVVFCALFALEAINMYATSKLLQSLLKGLQAAFVFGSLPLFAAVAKSKNKHSKIFSGRTVRNILIAFSIALLAVSGGMEIGRYTGGSKSANAPTSAPRVSVETTTKIRSEIDNIVWGMSEEEVIEMAGDECIRSETEDGLSSLDYEGENGYTDVYSFVDNKLYSVLYTQADSYNVSFSSPVYRNGEWLKNANKIPKEIISQTNKLAGECQESYAWITDSDIICMNNESSIVDGAPMSFLQSTSVWYVTNYIQDAER